MTQVFGSTQHLLSHQRLEQHVGYRDSKKGPEKTTAIESDTLNEVICPCGGQIIDSGSEEPLHCECGRVFQDAYGPARDAYDPSTSAFSCCTCGLNYDSWDEMWHHQLFIHHPCIGCHKIFVCETRLMQHQRQTNHCYCATCDEHFMTPDRLRQHLLETHRISRAEVFHDAADDERPLDPTATVTSPSDPPVFKGGFKSGKNFLHINLRCRACGRDFTSPKTLHDHRTRGWHDPFTSIGCPFDGGRCDAADRDFPSTSALLHHLETAQCGSGIALPDLNDALRGAELERFVVPELHLRPTPRDPCAALAERDVLALCDEQAVAAAAAGNDDGEAAGDRRLKLRCPFCPPSWKTYPTKQQLKAHLVSYNHTPRFLRYPEFVVLPPTKSKRKADFGSWSGLAHSLETLLCAGEVEGVQRALDVIEDRLRALGRLGEGEEEADVMMD
ncbi:hypothetical protein SLS56_002049 [Neofusicoccum ribis]|uniref:C2H2-type domain-containing protein n=1 Tax=Neofusicoccum ribis TaxID=45134 RepID=A0ABR3T610_9PEZI